jgi:hypothetical protein
VKISGLALLELLYLEPLLRDLRLMRALLTTRRIPVLLTTLPFEPFRIQPLILFGVLFSMSILPPIVPCGSLIIDFQLV